MRQFKIEVTNGEHFTYWLHDDNKLENQEELQPEIDYYMEMMSSIVKMVTHMRERDYTKIEINKL